MKKIIDFLTQIFSRKRKSLRLISKGERVVIPPLYGRSTIARSKGVFSYFHYYFTNCFYKPGPNTAEILVDIYEMEQGITFKQAFNHLNHDLDKLVLTQSQIVYLCRKRDDLFRQSRIGTGFLIKENSEYFVACVFQCSNGLEIRVFSFDYDMFVFRGDFLQIIVPRQASLAA